MLRKTHDVDEPSGKESVSQCTCGSCKNAWWVRAALEHQPSYCPYCGMKFVWYDDGAGGEFGLSGLRR